MISSGCVPGIPKARQYDGNVAPPASEGGTNRWALPRASGSLRAVLSLRDIFEKVRRPAHQADVPSEAAVNGLPDERKALVHRYTVDAETAEAEAPHAVRPATSKDSGRLTAVASQTADAPVPDAPAPSGLAVTAAAVREWSENRIKLGTLSALLVLSSAVGLLLVSGADALSRSGHEHGGVLFWLGLLAIFLPLTARLTSETASRSERVALLVLLGVASYMVKVFRDPFRFLYTDEFVHQYNAISIVSTHELFHRNPILAATPAYPGLEAPTAALSSLTGMSTFAAGLIVIGLARLILMLALFLLYETVADSGRVAGLAAALYAASPHYLFFIAQFSYESLALPIATLVLAAALRAHPPKEASRRAWLIVAIILTAGVVFTHHMTSYALIATLLAICLVPLPWLRRQPRRPWIVAAAAVALTAGWLVLVARTTVGYLSPVILGAVRETIKTAAGEGQTRQLFHSASGVQSPAWEHVTALLSAVLVAAALPFAIRTVWQRYRHLPVAIVFAVAAVAYLGTLGLRLVPAAWETAARASEFLFIGSAFLLALAALWALDRFPSVAARAGLIAAAAVLMVGGVISTTPSSTRLAETYRVSVQGGTIEPQGAALAQWANAVLGPGNRMAAGLGDGRFLLAGGRQRVFVGSSPPIKLMLRTTQIHPWEIALLRREGIRYVVTNRQPSGGDGGNGYYFFRNGHYPGLALASSKFGQAGGQAIYDSGNIVVYDIQGGLSLPQPVASRG
jgi:hypothetical protein